MSIYKFENSRIPKNEDKISTKSELEGKPKSMDHRCNFYHMSNCFIPSVKGFLTLKYLALKVLLLVDMLLYSGHLEFFKKIDQIVEARFLLPIPPVTIRPRIIATFASQTRQNEIDRSLTVMRTWKRFNITRVYTNI